MLQGLSTPKLQTAWLVAVALALSGCATTPESISADDAAPSPTTSAPPVDSTPETVDGSSQPSGPEEDSVAPQEPPIPFLHVNASSITPHDEAVQINISIPEYRGWAIVVRALTELTGDTYRGNGPTSIELDIPSGEWLLEVSSGNLTEYVRIIVEGKPIEFGAVTGDHLLRPGVGHDGCTTNFLYTFHHLRYFLGTAAHCVDNYSDGPEHVSAACSTVRAGDTTSGPGATATIRQGPEARLAYTSWWTMTQVGETDYGACAGNDFALLEISPEDYALMHPSVHFHGGPICVHEYGTAAQGDTLWGSGNSALWANQDPVKPKQGIYLYDDGTGYQHTAYMALPGIPGDSGSALLDANGCAMGAASTIAAAPDTGSNDYTDIGQALAYMQEHAGWAPTVVLSDDWNPSLVG